MKPEELRIGNWLQDFYLKKPYQVTANGISSFEKVVKDGRYQATAWLAIPLTEEWVIKLNLIDKNFKTLFYWTKEGWYFKFYEGDIKIEYVHQLQNLYFALTGEELEYEQSS